MTEQLVTKKLTDLKESSTNPRQVFQGVPELAASLKITKGVKKRTAKGAAA